MKLILAFAAAGLLISPISAKGLQCRDAKGKFAKCDKSLGAAAATGNFTKDKAGKCHVLNPSPGQKKGQFMPCPK